MGGTVRIRLIEPAAPVPNPAGSKKAIQRSFIMWAKRRDTAGSEFVQERTITVLADAVFRVQNLPGIRPTTDWSVVDILDGNREYRIERVARLYLNNMAWPNYLDLFCQFRGRRQAA